MNQFEKERRMAQRYKAEYPPGTRVVLHHMEDPYAPVESGTRGTVKLVDDIGQIHMHWDNGRTLALVPGQDSFRTLTEAELKQEERLKNGKVVDFGDDCQIVIPKEPIDCSKLGYFDEMEGECWDLVKGYLAKFGIPYADEIVAVRKRYGISASKMSLILGFGTNQYRLYEQGEVPNVSNGRMISSIMNPKVMLSMLESSKNLFTKSSTIYPM